MASGWGVVAFDRPHLHLSGGTEVWCPAAPFDRASLAGGVDTGASLLVVHREQRCCVGGRRGGGLVRPCPLGRSEDAMAVGRDLGNWRPGNGDQNSERSRGHHVHLLPPLSDTRP